jgi:hypothetical protein
LKGKLGGKAEALVGAVWGTFVALPEHTSEFVVEAGKKISTEEKKASAEP